MTRDVSRTMMDAEFREEHVLPGGARITLRLLRPDDAAELRRVFARLSPRSRYQRFLSGMPALTDEMVRYLTEIDGEDHVAVVATCDSLDLKTEEGLGVARFIKLREDPSVAEAAVTVVDDAQGKGIGRLLLHALATLAQRHGVRTFRGEVLAENARMRRLLTEVGARLEEGRDDEGQTLVYDVSLEGPAERVASEPEHPLRRLLRGAAESLGMAPPAPEPPHPR